MNWFETTEAKDAEAMIGEAVEAALRVFRTHKRGDIVSWKAMEGASGFKRYSRHWAAFQHRLRRDLLKETAIAVWPVTNEGLRLLTIDQQIRELPLWRNAKALRQTTKAKRALQSLLASDLTEHQRKSLQHQLNKVRNERRALLHSRRLQEKLSRPTSSGVPNIPPKQPRASIIEA